MAKILVTGSAGFIGFHLAKKPLMAGGEIVGLDNFNDYYDPAFKEALNEILERFPGYRLYRADLRESEALKKNFSGK